MSLQMIEQFCRQTLLQVLGAKKKTLAGFSTATARPHQGFIWNSEVIQQTPPAFRNKASRLVGAKCTLLARMDAYGQDPSGQAGDAMKVCFHLHACMNIVSMLTHVIKTRTLSLVVLVHAMSTTMKAVPNKWKV